MKPVHGIETFVVTSPLDTVFYFQINETRSRDWNKNVSLSDSKKCQLSNKWNPFTGLKLATGEYIRAFANLSNKWNPFTGLKRIYIVRFRFDWLLSNKWNPFTGLKLAYFVNRKT